MNPEHARIVSLGSPNNNFLYIDFLEPFSFPPFYVSEKTGALHDTAQSPGSAPLFVFFFFFSCCLHSTGSLFQQFIPNEPLPSCYPPAVFLPAQNLMAIFCHKYHDLPLG